MHLSKMDEENKQVEWVEEVWEEISSDEEKEKVIEKVIGEVVEGKVSLHLLLGRLASRLPHLLASHLPTAIISVLTRLALPGLHSSAALSLLYPLLAAAATTGQPVFVPQKLISSVLHRFTFLAVPFARAHLIVAKE